MREPVVTIVRVVTTARCVVERVSRPVRDANRPHFYEENKPRMTRINPIHSSHSWFQNVFHERPESEHGCILNRSTDFADDADWIFICVIGEICGCK